MLKDTYSTQLLFTETVIKTWALGFAHLLIFGAGKENSTVLSKQGHVRIAELERKPDQALLRSRKPAATGCGITCSCSRSCLASFSWIRALEFSLKMSLLGAVSLGTARPCLQQPRLLTLQRRLRRTRWFLNSPADTASSLSWFLKAFCHC